MEKSLPTKDDTYHRPPNVDEDMSHFSDIRLAKVENIQNNSHLSTVQAVALSAAYDLPDVAIETIAASNILTGTANALSIFKDGTPSLSSGLRGILGFAVLDYKANPASFFTGGDAVRAWNLGNEIDALNSAYAIPAASLSSIQNQCKANFSDHLTPVQSLAYVAGATYAGETVGGLWGALGGAAIGIAHEAASTWNRTEIQERQCTVDKMKEAIVFNPNVGEKHNI